jgi:hypothetical protein
MLQRGIVATYVNVNRSIKRPIDDPAAIAIAAQRHAVKSSLLMAFSNNAEVPVAEADWAGPT